MSSITTKYSAITAILDRERHCLIISAAGYDKEYFPIVFESLNTITTGDGTRWNRDNVAADREQKLADENQALRDQVELLEQRLSAHKS